MNYLDSLKQLYPLPMETDDEYTDRLEQYARDKEQWEREADRRVNETMEGERDDCSN